MAGGKETPRQKLIGMMYLVLLALLALQVGAEILVKFFELNQSLSSFTQDSQGKSEQLLSVITKKVSERGNKKEEAAALKDANKLHKASTSLISYVDSLKTAMITLTGGYMEDGITPAGMKNTDAPGMLFLGDNKGTPLGKELESKFDAYIDETNTIYSHVLKAIHAYKEESSISKENPVRKGEAVWATAYKKLMYATDSVITVAPSKDSSGYRSSYYPSMTLNGKEDPNFMNNEDQKKKSWLELAFDHTPQIACLAFLTEKQSKIAAYEGEILAQIKNSVGASDFKFDEVFAMALPNSNVVAAGMDYEAQMFITASSTSITPTMKFQGKEIAVDGNGRGSVKFRASGGSYDKDGRVKKTWKGEVTIPKPTGGGDTTFFLNQEYTVTKPVIQVQSGSVSALYKNCGNDLKILVPALGSSYKPVFGISGGGTARPGRNVGDVTIVPTGKKATITVSSGGSTIGSETFQVRPIPKPELVILASGKEVKAANFKNGMSCPRSLNIKIKPEPTFAGFLPKDANYYVEEFEVLLAAGKRPLGKKEIKNSGKKNMSSTAKIADLASKAKEGMRLIIEVKTVSRKNFQNKKEAVNLGGPQIFVIPLN